jgi:hypothetical protein
MKKIAMLLIVFAPFYMKAQEIVIVEAGEYMGFTTEAIPVFKTEVQRVSRKAFMDSWSKYLADQSDLKVARTDYDITIEQVVLKNIKSGPLNVYMHFEDMQEGTRVYIAFEDTVTGFIDKSDPKYGVALTKLIKERCLMVFNDAKKDDLKGEEKHLEVLEKEYEKIVKQEDKVSKEIMSKGRDIEKEKNDIEINKSVLDEVNDELATQRSNLNALSANTPSEVRKNTEKEVKKQESKRDKLSKSIDKSTSKIYEYEKDIRDLEYELDKLKQDEKFAMDKILTQRKVVQDLKDQVYELKK